nr:MAG TPA: hypothetical protein [Caudoviricetes sp.]
MPRLRLSLLPMCCYKFSASKKLTNAVISRLSAVLYT